MVSWQAFIVALLAAGALGGIALGAESQKETFLHDETLDADGLQEAASNLVTLTAVLPALAVALAAPILSRAPWKHRVAGSFGLFVATFALVWMIQSSWPNYDALQEQRAATFSITALVANGAAVPSVYLGVFCLFVAFGQLMAASARAMFPSEKTPPDASDALRKYLAAYLLGAPFLIVLAAGNVRLVTGLDSEQAGMVPYMLVLPLGALIALALLVTGAVKAWQLGAFVCNGRLRDSAETTWDGLHRIEWVLAGGLTALALLATLFQAINDELLEAGRTFAVTTRGHVQAQAFLLFPLLGWLTSHKRTMRAFNTPGGQATMDTATHPAVLASIITVGASLLIAAGATWVLGGALWSWLFAGLPLVILGWVVLGGHAGGALTLLVSLTLWGMGNTVAGAFSLEDGTGIGFDTPPGVLALFRMAAVVLLAVAVTRATRAHSHHVHAGLAWPMAVAAGIGAALIPYLELPFSAWIDSNAQGEFVGIGSALASQTYAVRATLHMLGAVAAFAGGMIASRILRPDWFVRKPPVPELAPVGSAS